MFNWKWMGMLSLLLIQSVGAVLPKQESKVMEEKNKQALVQLACEARKNAYAPYSHYLVGSALLASNGAIYQGANVENASYGLTCCSERVAIFKAVSEGINNFIAIAIATKEGAFPCGACRQVMYEFSPHLLVLIGDENGHLLQETTLSQLLPEAFGPRQLD